MKDHSGDKARSTKKSLRFLVAPPEYKIFRNNCADNKREINHVENRSGDKLNDFKTRPGFIRSAELLRRPKIEK